MSGLRSTAPKLPPNASLAAGAPSSPEKSPRLPRRGEPRSDRGQTPVPGPAGRVRRTRGKARKARGGGAPTPRGFAAASDDASGLTGMDAASSAATPPARPACAAAAQLRDDGATPRVPGDAERACEQARESSAAAEMQDAVAGEPTVITDGSDFVDAIFARLDPVEVSCRLLASEDERIVEKHFERLLDIKFGRPSTSLPGDDGSPAFVWDLPQPDRG